LVITLSPSEPFGADARLPGGRYARYVSDPATGLWRTVGGCPRELVTPYALVELEVGRHGIAIEAGLPGTGETLAFEGDTDNVATALWRAARARGCRADRQAVFWALCEFTDQARRQAAARGVAV